MIKRVSHATLYVKDQNEALRFYTEILGFEVRADVTQGDFRWLTIGVKDQPDFEFILFQLKPDNVFLNEQDVKTLTALMEQSKLGSPLLNTDNIQKDYEMMTAKGVEFLHPPTDQGYAIEAIFKDNSGNTFSLHQDKR
ncbi:MAG TPA: VOC family protein [Phototrophicaceae bacterium]|nr:VOC family protein [Phototrophicaceae bacterium]